MSGPQLQPAQSSNSSRFNRQENLCRFGIFSYHHIIRPCSINTTYSSDFLCYPSGSCQQNIFLKLKNDSRKHVGLNPLPRAHYYPAQPDHLQPRKLEDFQGRFGRPGYKLQIIIHRILVTQRIYIYEY